MGESVEMAKPVDPVCGMNVEISNAIWKTELGYATYHFCSPVCKRTFDENIDKVLDIEALQQSPTDQRDQDHSGHLSNSHQLADPYIFSHILEDER